MASYMIVDTAPELLAHHFSEAELVEEAVEYWQRAGLRSATRSANAESISQFERAIEMLQRLAETPDRTRLELQLRIDMTGPLIAAHGHASPAMETNVERAMGLSKQSGETGGIFPILYGRWVFHFVTGKVKRSCDLGTEFLDLATRERHRELAVLGHRILGHSLLVSGNPAAADTHLSEAARFNAPEPERSPPFVYGQDVQSAAMCISAWSRFHAGCADQAIALAEGALTRARGLEHPNTLGYSLTHACFLFVWLRLEDHVRATLDELVAVHSEHSLPVFRAASDLLQVGLMSIVGDFEGVLEAGDPALEKYRETTRMVYLTPGMELWKADAAVSLGEGETALSSIDRALELASSTGENFQLAEILRVKANAMRLLECDDVTVAAYVRAIEVARNMKTRWYELRAATDFARFYQNRGMNERAVGVLKPLYRSFKEGVSTPDMAASRILLEELT